MRIDRLPERLVRCVVGLGLFGLGISLLITAELGLAPWDVFHQGLSKHTGLGLGWWIEIVGALLLVVSWLLLGQRPGVGTVINAIEIGLVVALIGDRLPHGHNVPVRVLDVLAGILAIGVGSGLYIGAGLGTGPRDGLMMGLAARGLSVRVARTVIEATVLVIGVLLGGSVGVGTVAFTLGIGPVVHSLIPRLGIAALPAEQRPQVGTRPST